VVRSALGGDLVVEGPRACAAGWEPERGQHRADTVLAACVAPSPPDRLVVGVLAVDLFMPGLNFVFGLANPGLRAAVVSWARLQAPNLDLWALRLAKEVIHEVGHLRGLVHCSDRTCVMHFSNTLADTDAKRPSFCARCARQLPQATDRTAGAGEGVAPS
jgi:archaemetzincin